MEATGLQGQQIQITVDDSDAPLIYSSLVRIGGSAEEIILDFAGPLRATGPRTATMKIEQRVVMSPWAAKRLALSLMQAIHRYEQTYGELEIDERKRRVGGPGAPPQGKVS